MKIAFFSTKSYDTVYFDQANDNESHQITYFQVPLNAETAILAKGFDAVCVFVNDKLDASVIEVLASSGIEAIALRCAGYNNVDLQAASSNHIKVVRVPAYSPQAVAEHALALILTLNRKTHKAYNRIRENNFSIEHLTGFNLFEKTVGVIGTGLIGAAFCRIMLGMGCKVLAFDIHPNPTLQALGVEYDSMDEVMANADILSLHCPLTPETYHLIDQKAIEKMKPGVMLINTSRGGLIHTEDAIDALKQQQLGYLGIDVYEQEAGLFFRDLSESFIQDDVIARLMTFPNVLITGHQGFFTKEALLQISHTTLQNLSAVENGDICKNEVQ